MTYYLSGHAIEDHCKYIKTIKTQKNIMLSGWVLDEFFAPLPDDKDLTNSWLSMSNKKKFDLIFNSLMAPDEKGEKCKD